MNVMKKLKQANDLLNSNNVAAAEKIVLKILSSNPRELLALFLMGMISMKKDNPPLALEYFERGTRVNPDFDRLWFNRGVVLTALNRFPDAITSYERALSLNSTYVDALNNLGIVLQEMGRYEEAVVVYDRLLTVHPAYDKALSNKGYILMVLGRYEETIDCLNLLLREKPDYDLAPGMLASAMLYGCIWEEYDRVAKSVCDGVAAGKFVCKTLGFMSISDSPEDHYLCAKTFAQKKHPPAATRLWQGEIYRHEKIRVAYVSPDFREHPVAHLMAGILEQHDKSRFETYGFFLGIPDQSAIHDRIAGSFDQFFYVRLKGAREVAEIIRAMEIDIVVDLAGYTLDARTDIFTYRPAPVQVNYLGHPGSMGAEYMDYILADSVVIPPGDQDKYSEKIVHLPASYLPADATLTVAERTPSREEFGLPPTGFVFCSFNHAYKINPAIFDVWMRILTQTPGSVLWLMKLNSIAEPNLRKEAQARGVDPARLIFATRVPRVEDHLARYRLADLFLDTTPYNAHTTACDALFVGLPVLTCLGRAFPGRVAASLLCAIGLTELIAPSLAAYENIAVRLAHEEPLLAGLKEKLKANRDTYPLFKTEEFCRNLEYAYTVMQQRTRQGEKPSDFQVIRG